MGVVLTGLGTPHLKGSGGIRRCSCKQITPTYCSSFRAADKDMGSLIRVILQGLCRSCSAISRDCVAPVASVRSRKDQNGNARPRFAECRRGNKPLDLVAGAGFEPAVRQLPDYEPPLGKPVSAKKPAPRPCRFKRFSNLRASPCESSTLCHAIRHGFLPFVHLDAPALGWASLTGVSR